MCELSLTKSMCLQDNWGMVFLASHIAISNAWPVSGTYSRAGQSTPSKPLTGGHFLPLFPSPFLGGPFPFALANCRRSRRYSSSGFLQKGIDTGKLKYQLLITLPLRRLDRILPPELRASAGCPPPKIRARISFKPSLSSCGPAVIKE